MNPYKCNLARIIKTTAHPEDFPGSYYLLENPHIRPEHLVDCFHSTNIVELLFNPAFVPEMLDLCPAKYLAKYIPVEFFYGLPVVHQKRALLHYYRYNKSLPNIDVVHIDTDELFYYYCKSSKLDWKFVHSRDLATTYNTETFAHALARNRNIKRCYIGDILSVDETNESEETPFEVLCRNKHIKVRWLPHDAIYSEKAVINIFTTHPQACAEHYVRGFWSLGDDCEKRVLRNFDLRILLKVPSVHKYPEFVFDNISDQIILAKKFVNTGARRHLPYAQFVTELASRFNWEIHGEFLRTLSVEIQYLIALDSGKGLNRYNIHIVSRRTRLILHWLRRWGLPSDLAFKVYSHMSFTEKK